MYLSRKPSGGTLITGQFTDATQRNESALHTYYYVIPPLQVVPGRAGRYTDNPRFRLWENTTGGPVRRDQDRARHRARVPEAVQLSLVNYGGPFDAADVAQTLNFETLSAGKILDFDLRVRGNTAFTVTMRSQNRGVLAHADSAPSSVPYELSVGGSAYDLSGGGDVQVASFSGDQTDIQGEVYAVQVEIGNLSGTLAGLHRDNVTITVSAQ